MEALILYFWFQSSIWPIRASLVAQMVKNLPAMKETQVQSLGQEDPLEKDMATHASILAWKIPRRSLVGYSPWGRKQSDMNERLHFHFPDHIFRGCCQFKTLLWC